MSTSTVTVDRLSSVVHQAVTDPAFRAQLLANPSATLQRAGISIPAGASLKVVEPTQSLRYAIVPARPDGISDADLATLTSESIVNDGSVAGNVAAYAHLVAKSWTDSSLRASLLSNPASTLAAHGIRVPSGVQIEVIEVSVTELVVCVPPPATSNAAAINIGDIGESITQSFEALIKLITVGAYLAGLGFTIGAIMKFKQHQDNPTQVPIGTPIALAFIAAVLLFLPAILAHAAESHSS